MHRPRFLVPLFAIGGFALAGQFLAKRNPERFDPVVECSRGHRYRSIWVPGGSLKGLRWFRRRLQWCPVGRHWSWTRRVPGAQLSAAEFRAASATHDLRLA